LLDEGLELGGAGDGVVVFLSFKFVLLEFTELLLLNSLLLLSASMRSVSRFRISSFVVFEDGD
jgi:hypothetical protein